MMIIDRRTCFSQSALGIIHSALRGPSPPQLRFNALSPYARSRISSVCFAERLSHQSREHIWKRVDISTVVMCYASDIMKYDRRTPELSNASLHMKQSTTSIEHH